MAKPKNATTGEEYIRRVQFVSDAMSSRIWNDIAAMELAKKWHVSAGQMRRIAAEASRIVRRVYSQDKEGFRAELAGFFDRIAGQALNKGNPTTSVTVRRSLDDAGHEVITERTETRMNPDYHSAIKAGAELGRLMDAYPAAKSELTGKDGGPIKTEGMTDTELQALAQKLLRKVNLVTDADDRAANPEEPEGEADANEPDPKAK